MALTYMMCTYIVTYDTSITCIVMYCYVLLYLLFVSIPNINKKCILATELLTLLRRKSKQIHRRNRSIKTTGIKILQQY